MENKTALQELIEIIQEERKTEYHNYVLNFVYQKAIDLLDKEKQQIIEAFYDGKDIDCRFENAVEYYKETYEKE